MRRGDVLTVVGSGFEDCLDGDEPLWLVVVQASTSVNVGAIATADPSPSFEVRVGVPAELDPGGAQLRARTTVDPDAEVLASAAVVVDR